MVFLQSLFCNRIVAPESAVRHRTVLRNLPPIAAFHMAVHKDDVGALTRGMTPSVASLGLHSLATDHIFTVLSCGAPRVSTDCRWSSRRQMGGAVKYHCPGGGTFYTGEFIGGRPGEGVSPAMWCEPVIQQIMFSHGGG